MLQLDGQIKKKRTLLCPTFGFLSPYEFIFFFTCLKQFYVSAYLVNYEPRRYSKGLCEKVYSVSIENEEQLWNIIQNVVQELQNEDTLRRVHFNFLRRIDFCINENGGYFEHLIKSQEMII
ncbi:hypothetical protein NQ318_000361 [Aromia moschata]|uniref:Uncharacterized protein n=1 Tax=Aromia moschata TaxID=1265417 RepID=A0AAV8X8Y8_9CUCU|nr:hypothetical protein NQ318_000361 [Aromia moschata]